jgi:hypothetical protein
MYFETRPCAVCGSEVTLRPREAPPADDAAGAVGSPTAVVGAGDSTVDERVCTNSQCRTNTHQDRGPVDALSP